jgi:1,4-dihydroxy-2-naphthoate octaprenyltransferase
MATLHMGFTDYYVNLCSMGSAYHEFHFDSHWLTRNVCNAWFYSSLNAGAAMVAAGTFYVLFIHPSLDLTRYNNFTHVSGESRLATRTAISVAVNSLIVFSTIQSQDFRDLVGDEKTGRWTLPIAWPIGSRISMLVTMTAWSVGLSRACDLAHLFSVPFCMWAIFIGLRFIRKRTPKDDRQSYHYFNVRF